ncbi:MAG: GH116 family glycosyl hydrolase [Sedimentisphaerales bacterium]
MPKSSKLKMSDIFTISGAQIPEIYVKNKMGVHFQGMSKTMQFPPTIFLQGAPTCSIGISPDGLYNRINDTGRLVYLNQKAIQLASAPFVRIEDKTIMLTTKKPGIIECPDDIPVSDRYYYMPVEYKQVTISIATPITEMTYKLGKAKVTRRLISPFLAGNDQTLMPIGVEEYEIENTSNKVQQITLVIPRPSLANLQEKKYRPIDQDSAFICSIPLTGQVHNDFSFAGIRGVEMASKDSPGKMVIAVPQIKGVKIDTQPYFKLNSFKQDLLLRPDGSFYSKIERKDHNDYGAAISVTFTLRPKAKIEIPVAIALDFPMQWYADNTKFERKYVKSFKNQKTRAKDMAKIALENYSKWQSRTETIQNRIFELVQKNPSYKNDRNGALLLTRLIVNEFHFPLVNAAAWIEDKKGNQVARFLECFDYPYVNSQDVDWFSPILLMLFPEVEKEICQRFIDSIMDENLKERYYHNHASFAEARQHFEEHPEDYEGYSLTHIKAATKIKGSVSHDLTALTFGNPMRNKSEYAWYNTNYWIDLFPKIALRVLRNVKYTGDMKFLKDNWKTLKFGFEYLEKLDLDGDGIPEGNPHEVKNTFDNITLFGIDSYSTNGFLAACKAMSKMAEMMKDGTAKKEYEEIFEKGLAVYEKLWIDTKNNHGRRMQYYATCIDLATGKTNADVWTNQLDGLWYLIAMGEEPFIPEDKVKKILKTIYENNRNPMGWATARTQDGKPVESDQGKDVWIASNYVLAQLLDYYGLTKESKEVYKVMDNVIFQHANSLMTPESIRPTFEKEAGESTTGPHFIVQGYTRPGAIYMQLMIQFVKETRNKTKSGRIDSRLLNSFIKSLF